MMFHRWVICAVAAVGALAAAGQTAPSRTPPSALPEAHPRMPAFTRPTIDGKTFESASQQHGRPLLIVYWAAWCRPCHNEAPLLRRIKAAYGERLLMAGIAAGEGEELEDVKSAARSWQLNYPVIYDQDESLKIIFNVQMIPQLILIDSEQRLVIRTMDLHALQAQLDILLPPVVIEPTKAAPAAGCGRVCA
jgi:peroxiredoxin